MNGSRRNISAAAAHWQCRVVAEVSFFCEVVVAMLCTREGLPHAEDRYVFVASGHITLEIDPV